MSTLISIIIPCKEIDSYAKECVDYCKQLNYESYEIVLLPDDTSIEIDDVKVISTGQITPGEKRNIGIANSSGALCAFLDSDAYPREDWLQNAAKYFEDPDNDEIHFEVTTLNSSGIEESWLEFNNYTNILSGISN